MILSRILVWLISLPLVLTIGIWIHFPFALSLKVPFSASSLITGGGGGGGGGTTLFYTIHKKRQNCSIKKCNSVTFSTHKGCVLPLFCLWKCTE